MDLVYLIGPSVLIVVVLVAALLDRWSVPIILIAMGTGILFGSDVLNIWAFSDFGLANQIANIALVFILFHGGFSTRREDFRAVALPAGGMATWGVALTALATFLVLWGVLRWPLEIAALIAVIISSTDAAATFSILRRQSLPKNLTSTVKIESGANDPMAILLTLALVQAFTTGDAKWYAMVGIFFWKFVGGLVLGWVLANAALWLYNSARIRDRGHYYVLSIGVILLIYGVAELAATSGMLAVFIAGFVMGNRPFVYKQGTGNFSSALATVSDIIMFVLLGLLVAPRGWSDIWLQGILLFAVLTFVARPLAVFLGTMGMGIKRRKRVFIAWAGLRGAVPIVLATYPMAAGMPEGQDIFDLVFFAVILSILVQGSTIGLVAKWLGLSVPQRPEPMYNLELITMAPSDLDLIVIDLPGPRGVRGPEVHDLKLPQGAVITLVTRPGTDVVVPKGSTALLGWDQVTVLARAKDEPEVRAALLEPFYSIPRPTQPTPTEPSADATCEDAADHKGAE